MLVQDGLLSPFALEQVLETLLSILVHAVEGLHASSGMANESVHIHDKGSDFVYAFFDGQSFIV